MRPMSMPQTRPGDPGEGGGSRRIQSSFSGTGEGQSSLEEEIFVVLLLNNGRKICI